MGSLYRTGGAGPGVELDLAKGALVLGDVLLQDVEQGLGLLGAQVDALKSLDIDGVRAVLVDEAEFQVEVPEVDAHLNAVGVALAELRPADDIDFDGLRLGHRDYRGAGEGG